MMGRSFDGQRAVNATAQQLREKLEELLRKRNERFDYIEGDPAPGHPGGGVGLEGNSYTYLDLEICRLARALEALLR